MAKPKFNPVYYQNFTTNAKGELTYDNDTWNQINARNEAIQKIERANQLKLEIQTETNNLLAQYAKEKQGFETKAKIGKVAQFVADPRMWAKVVWEVGKMVTENPRDVFIGAPRGALQSKEATKLYEQSAALNNEATRLAQTDKAKSEELLRQSQELYKTAQEKYSKAVSNLGELTTGKQIAAKSALAGLDIGSFLPVGGAIKGGVAATQATSKLATKVPAAIQTTKLTGRANLLSNALGLGDIYQGTQVAIKQGLGEATEQTLRGQAARAAIQGPVYGTLEVLADEEQEDTLGNIVKSSFINGITASGLTLAFGWAGRALVSKVAPKAGTMPTPTPPDTGFPQRTRAEEIKRIQGIEADFLARTAEPTQAAMPEPTPTQDPIKQSLGAFDPETTIPMLDLTKTVKGNNIDFNPDSALSVNSARKVVDDLALLNGKQVGGKSLQIDKNDPKYQEIYNNQIKPLVDRINEVDANVKPATVDVMQNIKQQQLNKINKLNPMLDEIHTGIRTIDDIKTYQEAFNDPESFVYPDYSKKDAQKAIDSGKITIYSSKPLNKNNGQFVTPSKMQATDYAGSGKVYSKIVDLNDVAWINGDEGQLIGKVKAQVKSTKTLEPQYISSKDVQKIPVEDVEMEVNKIYSELENEGFNIVPEKVVDTPAIDAVDDKLAKGDQPTAQEMDASMKELADTTGDPEVKAGVQQELNDRVKKSRFFERVKSANPEAIDPNASVFYEASRRAEDEKFADNLVINDFDKALEIASDINTKANPTGRDNLVVQKTIKKLIELGRNDEVNNITGNLSYKLTKSGDFIAATANSTIADPVSVILKQTQIRQSKFSKEIQTEVAKVKEQLNNVVIDKDAIIEILDNITCR